MSAFQPAAALRVLTEHDVRFVLVGGLAGAVLGAPTVTDDVDICLDTSDENPDRAAAAFTAMGATERVSSAALGGELLRCDTGLGRVDVLNTPRGTAGYGDLMAGADATDLGGFVVHVVALDDLIRMKRAAARPKDRIEVEVLIALRDAITERS